MSDLTAQGSPDHDWPADPQTLPQYFMEKVQRYGDRQVALRQKEFGIWHEFTWAESFEQIKAFSLGLLALGLEWGDRVCGIGDNDREYLWAFLGLQLAGGVQVGLFTDAAPNEIAYVVTHSEATFVLAQDQEQCDKLLTIKDDAPLVQKVIYWDEKGLWHYEDDWLISFAEVQALGHELAKEEPDRFDQLLAQGKGDDLGALCYTSGTTGLPKGVMLSHANMIASSRHYQEVDPRYSSDNHMSFLPLGWIGEVVLGFSAHVYTGLILNFPEEPETVRQNIREIAPESLLYNSRLWDNIVASVQVQMNDASWINRKLYGLFLPVGYR